MQKNAVSALLVAAASCVFGQSADSRVVLQQKLSSEFPLTQIKADTDAARKATAQLAFWVTASLLLGAFCASLAATEGGGLRDGTWKSRGRLSPAVRT